MLVFLPMMIILKLIIMILLLLMLLLSILIAKVIAAIAEAPVAAKADFYFQLSDLAVCLTLNVFLCKIMTFGKAMKLLTRLSYVHLLCGGFEPETRLV